MREFDNNNRDLFSKRIRAGKRTYFFDVRSTKNNDCYIVITESKKRFEDGTFIKHKIFVYKEDFESFNKTLAEAINFIKKQNSVTDKKSDNNSEKIN
ncbi:MAG: DUF3276 family protein [Bacteroides sp.]|nr:MAG: DUF3276 family protein [Bacteroides sp.]